jgi:phi13 family phage major tail protein
MALPPVGDPVKVYADNVVYAKFNVNQGYDGTLSVYNIPQSFATDILGQTVDSNGVLVENASAVQSDFALIGEFCTDTAQTKRFVLYNCSAGRSDLNGATKEDTVEAQAFSIPITVAPLEGSEYVKAAVTGDASNSTWAAWLSSVYMPALTAQYKVAALIQVGTTPIANALVVCGGKIGFTDAAGKAYFMLPTGAYDILVSASGHTAKADTVTVATADISKSITLVA